MVQIILGVVLAAAVGAVAGNALLINLFDVTLADVWEKLPSRGPLFAMTVGLPILLWVVRGLLGWVFSILALGLGVFAALKFGVEDSMPFDQALTLTGAYAVTAVVVYKLTLGQLFD